MRAQSCSARQKAGEGAVRCCLWSADSLCVRRHGAVCLTLLHFLSLPQRLVEDANRLEPFFLNLAAGNE